MKHLGKGKEMQQSHSDNSEDRIRLQVYLSRNGVCSRRKAMDVIKDGNVSVNGKIIFEPSFPVDARKDKIEVSNKTIESKKYSYVLLNKPVGYVVTKEDRHAEKTVYDLLPEEYNHLASVGRLDKDSEGLLLLTNDGDLAFKLTHPKFNIIKTYYVKVRGLINKSIINELQHGILLDGKMTLPCKINDVKVDKNLSELIISIHEGRKRQIRLMFDCFNLKVIKLKRLSQGPIQLGSLEVGKFRRLIVKEILMLRNL